MLEIVNMKAWTLYVSENYTVYFLPSLLIYISSTTDKVVPTYINRNPYIKNKLAVTIQKDLI